MTPNDSPARQVSHNPPTTRKSPRARSELRRLWDSAPRGAPTRKLASIRQMAAKVAAEKACFVPRALATAPTTGPRSAPATEEPSATPSALPRRSAGVPAASQAIAPDQVQAPPMPWARRAVSSTTIELPKPKTSVAPLMRKSPVTTAALTPRRLATTPLGKEPTMVPRGYAATRIPASVLERWRLCT